MHPAAKQASARDLGAPASKHRPPGEGGGGRARICKILFVFFAARRLQLSHGCCCRRSGCRCGRAAATPATSAPAPQRMA